MEISQKLLTWYQKNKRALPWRKDSDPYMTWVSEIILQQTRISQGQDYYIQFIKRFPDVESLARARTEEVLLVWEGLGYYSRARNMHHAARTIVDEYQGVFPSEYKELIKLKGIGTYTAAAIASISFGEKCAVVDGNVNRVLSRLFGIEEEPGISPTRSQIYKKATEILDDNDPGNHNQALMELGARICKPAHPRCTDCPLNQQCYAYCEARVDQLPLKKKPPVRRKRFFHYLVIMNRNSTYIKQRLGRDIWQDMYEFPMIESSRKLSGPGLTGSEKWLSLFGGQEMQLLKTSTLYKHQLTHQEIDARFYYIVPWDKGSFSLPGLRKIALNEVDNYPMPVLIRRSLKELGWMKGTD